MLETEHILLVGNSIGFSVAESSVESSAVSSLCTVTVIALALDASG